MGEGLAQILQGQPLLGFGPEESSQKGAAEGAVGIHGKKGQQSLHLCRIETTERLTVEQKVETAQQTEFEEMFQFITFSSR